jgi:cysteine-rich CPXCG protein
VIEEAVLDCPHCGEPAALTVDTSAGDEQSYYEDCAVCCRPMEIFVRCRPGEILGISVTGDG